MNPREMQKKEIPERFLTVDYHKGKGSRVASLSLAQKDYPKYDQAKKKTREASE